MKQHKICASCLQENEADALECSKCGMPFQFDVRTPAVSLEFRSDPTTQEMARVETKTPVPKGMIALNIVSDPTPILISYAEQRIVLGRGASESNAIEVDLTNYGAQILGVSRQHATILITAEGCILQDLNSTNGTWLNENRLTPEKPYPLQTGDLVRLGHLMIFISFQD